MDGIHIRNKKRFLVFLYIILFTSLINLPLIKADVIISVFFQFTILYIILFIPILLIETFSCYFLFRANFFNEQGLKFWYCLLIFLIANGITTFIGYIFQTLHLPIYTNTEGYLLLFFLSILFEFPIIYLFLRKKLEIPVIASLYTSVIVNSLSYFFIFIFLIVGNHL